MTSWKHKWLTSCGLSPDHYYYDNLKSGLPTVTGRQSIPGQGHCSNRRQRTRNSSRKGRQDSHARVQTVQAGRGPGGWTRRRGWNVAPDLAYHTRYQINRWYRSQNFDIIISSHCTNIMYDIKAFAFDILISRYCNTISYPISNKTSILYQYQMYKLLQRASKLNIVLDIDGVSSISMQYRMYKVHCFGAS